MPASTAMLALSAASSAAGRGGLEAIWARTRALIYVAGFIPRSVARRMTSIPSPGLRRLYWSLLEAPLDKKLRMRHNLKVIRISTIPTLSISVQAGRAPRCRVGQDRCSCGRLVTGEHEIAGREVGMGSEQKRCVGADAGWWGCCCTCGHTAILHHTITALRFV